MDLRPRIRQAERKCEIIIPDAPATERAREKVREVGIVSMLSTGDYTIVNRWLLDAWNRIFPPTYWHSSAAHPFLFYFCRAACSLVVDAGFACTGWEGRAWFTRPGSAPTPGHVSQSEPRITPFSRKPERARGIVGRMRSQPASHPLRLPQYKKAVISHRQALFFSSPSISITVF